MKSVAVCLLRRYMESEDLNAKGLAISLGLSESYISKILNGSVIPSSRLQRRINKKVGIVNDWI